MKTNENFYNFREQKNVPQEDTKTINYKRQN